MSRTISFRGLIDDGGEDRIPLQTIQGLIGYRITKFECMQDGFGNSEMVIKVWKTKQSTIDSTVDFSNNRLLAVVYYQDDANPAYPSATDVIFDNEKFNQDIFVNITDGAGGTVPCNYYIELEQMSLDLNEQTVATLKDIRNVGAE